MQPEAGRLLYRPAFFFSQNVVPCQDSECLVDVQGMTRMAISTHKGRGFEHGIVD